MHDISGALVPDETASPTGMTNYGQFKETKLKDKYFQIYGKEGTQEQYVQLLQEILLNGLEPTQRLLIKRFNRTMGADETYTNRVNTFATNVSDQKIVGTASITVRTLDIENRIFVIDYGKKVHFHGEQIFTDAEMQKTWLKLDVSTTDTPDWKIISENPVAVGKYGKATLGEEDNQTKYFQYELDRYMSASEAFKIGIESKVDESEPGTHKTLVKTVTMMPASNIYYEDDFDSKVVSEMISTTKDTEFISQSGIVYQGNWKRIGEGNITYQEGKETEGDSPYGFDSNYDNQTTFSDGTAWVADVTDGKVARAYFEFKGNGFDIYSRTNLDTAQIRVALYQKQIDGSWKSLKIETIDTLYKMGDLYQVPIISMNKNNLPTLRYGTYRVELIVARKATETNDGYRGLFYLDGIRIYNPAGTSVETEVEYAKNNEANANYTEIRDILLSAPEGDGVLKGNGAVYIDSMATETAFDGNNPGEQIVSKVATYETYGPKNEVYLNDGKNEAKETKTGSIAFGVTYKKGMTLQIGARAPENIEGTPKIQVIVSKNSDTAVEAKTPIELMSTADMYYRIDIPAEVKEGDEITVTIINNSGLNGTNIEEGTNFVALTKLKQSFDSITSTASVYTVTDETVEIATQSVRKFMLMRRSVNVPEEEPLPEETQPEATQPEVSQPEAKPQEVTQSGTTVPEVKQPVTTQAEASKPEVTKPGTTQVETSKQEASQSQTTQPKEAQTESQKDDDTQLEQEESKAEKKGFFRSIIDFIMEILSNILEWLGIGEDK